MIAIKSSRQRTPILGYKRKPKIKYMSGDRYQDQMHIGDLGHLRDVRISLEKIFENQAYLAHNHWIGIFRITYVNNWKELGVVAGDYNQYVVDTAASRDTVVGKIQRAVLDELEYHSIDPELNFTDLDIDDENVKSRPKVIL